MTSQISGTPRIIDAGAGVSVVIPAYNYAHFLGNAIDSALAQEYAPLEIIVVDDGSTDSTAAVAAAYGEKVRYIYQQNAGLSSARNTGINASSHPFIAFLDADDVWLPAWLPTAMRTFATLPEGFGLVACRWRFVDLHGNQTGPKSLDRRWPREISTRDLLIRSQFQPSGTVVRKQAFTHCGLFDTNLKSSEDRDMWVRIAARFRVYVLGDALVRVLDHPRSMSKQADRMKQNMRLVFNKARESGVVPISETLFWRRVYACYFYQTAWMYRNTSSHRIAITDVLRSLVCWPFFLHPHHFNENYFFRIRTLAQFLRECWKSGNASTQAPTNEVSGISVIIPAYNYAHFLRDAIDSAVAQETDQLEIIVVDDGSTDSTRELVASYGDKVRYIYQDNAGLSAARNTGITAARHAWIALLDADDVFMPGMLNRLASKARELPQEYGLVACDCRRMNERREPLIKKKLFLEPNREVLARDILMRNQFVADAVLFRRDVALQAGGFDITLRSSEDRDMWIRMSRHCRIYKITQPLIWIRMHGSSMSTNAKRMRSNMTRVLDKAKATGVMSKWHLLFWVRAHSFLLYQSAWMHRNAGDLRSAMGDLMKSMLLYPFFINPHGLNENYLFRVRSMGQFVSEAWRSRK